MDNMDSTMRVPHALVLVAAFLASVAHTKRTKIAVDDSLIAYTGRFDARVAGVRTFSWSGCQIDVKFRGLDLEAYLSGSYPGEVLCRNVSTG